jgi:hypothetical protein
VDSSGYIGGIMVLNSSVVDHGFEPRSCQTNDYKIGMCCFSTKHAALRNKSKDWLARNQVNVSKWSDMSARGQLFQWASTICWSSTKQVSWSSHRNVTCACHDIAEHLLILALNNNHSLFGLLWKRVNIPHMINHFVCIF